MSSPPWPEIEANPDMYIDHALLPAGFRLRKPAQMSVSEVWTLISHIQDLEQCTPGQFGFRPRDNLTPQVHLADVSVADAGAVDVGAVVVGATDVDIGRAGAADVDIGKVGTVNADATDAEIGEAGTADADTSDADTSDADTSDAGSTNLDTSLALDWSHALHPDVPSRRSTADTQVGSKGTEACAQARRSSISQK